MSRKHYIALAAIIADMRSFPEYDSVTLARVAERQADLFQQENSRFDRARFLKACGI